MGKREMGVEERGQGLTREGKEAEAGRGREGEGNGVGGRDDRRGRMERKRREVSGNGKGR